MSNQNRESMNLKIGQLKVFSLRRKKKKTKVTEPKEPADTIEHTKTHFMGLPEGKRAERIFLKIMIENH